MCGGGGGGGGQRHGMAEKDRKMERLTERGVQREGCLCQRTQRVTEREGQRDGGGGGGVRESETWTKRTGGCQRERHRERGMSERERLRERGGGSDRD